MQERTDPKLLPPQRPYDLVDYASPETRAIGEKVIEKELLNIPKEKVREIARQHIEDIKNNNKRDFRF